jgi:hypothetical protein
MKHKHVTGIRTNIIHKDERRYKHVNTKRKRLVEEQTKHFNFQNFRLKSNINSKIDAYVYKVIAHVR